MCFLVLYGYQLASALHEMHLVYPYRKTSSYATMKLQITVCNAHMYIPIGLGKKPSPSMKEDFILTL